MADAVNYATAPAIGTVLDWGGQTYQVAKVLSMRLRDGTPYCEITWSFECVDCDAPTKVVTGGRKRYLPRRCRSCNGPDDLDGAERRAYAKASFGRKSRDRRAAAQAKRFDIANLHIEDGTFMRHGQGMNCTIVARDGSCLEWGYAPGMTPEDCEGNATAIAALPLMQAEFERLTLERLMS